MGGCTSKEDNELAQQVLGAKKAKDSNAVKRLSAVGMQDGHIWVTRPTDDIRKEFKFGAQLGKGQFGTIFVVTNAAGEKFACKQISKRKLAGPTSVRDIRREIEVMHHLRGHPNVINFHGAYEDANDVYLVMELCTGGDLFERMESTATITERSAAALFRGLVETVSYCHTLGVVHRDLKPENFLITDKSPDAAIKLADFGLSCFYHEGQELDEVVGSAYYMAPEVIGRSYGKACDVWSLGVVLHILLSGVPPFTGSSDAEIIRAVRTQDVNLNVDPWPSISRHARHLVSKMLEKDPENRLRMDQVLTHPWLRTDGTATARAIPSGVHDRVLQFHALNTFKREARRILAAALPPEEVTGLKHLFEELDANKDGLLTLAELKEGLAKRGESLQGEEAAALMKAADLNGDGFIDYREFIAATYNMSRMQQQDVLIKAFKHFDLDGDGFITKDELAAALSRLPSTASRESAAALLAEADTNQDGKLDYREFAAMVLAAQPGAAALGLLQVTQPNEASARVSKQVAQNLPGLVFEDKKVHGGSTHGDAGPRGSAGGGTSMHGGAGPRGSPGGGGVGGVSGSRHGSAYGGVGVSGSKHGGAVSGSKHGGLYGAIGVSGSKLGGSDRPSGGSRGSRGRVGGWTAHDDSSELLESDDEELMNRARPSVAPDKSVRGGVARTNASELTSF